MKALVASVALLVSMPLAAQAPIQPRTDDYANGMTIDVPQQRPVVEILLPDQLYQGTVRTDLADMRVFNAEGQPVLHAVCASDAALAPLISREPLGIFEVEAVVPGKDGTRVDVRTAAGTQVEVNEAASENAEAATTIAAYVIDARAITSDIRAIDFDWSHPDGASEARVQIQSSEDLDTWQTVVAGSTLLKLDDGAEQLRRQKIPLPQRRYAYLRVQRVDKGSPIHIDAARAEVVATPVMVEPVWFNATVLTGATPRSLLFSSPRLAPVTYARLSLPQANSSVRVSISSRNDDKATWRTQWSGEVYTILTNGERRVSPPAEFQATHDKYWRIESSRAGDPFYDTASLELGYRPAKLRFLAQGTGPFTLAYGSRRAEPAPAQSCDRLLADVNSKDMADLVVQTVAMSPRSLGGEAALKPLPARTPTRLLVLWGVLIAGVGLLIAMAMSLFKRLNQPMA